MGGLGAHAQFVAQRLQAQQAFYAGDELQVVDGLRQEVVGTGLQASHAVGRLVECCDHDDGNMGGLRIGLQPLADFETVDAGHHDVEQDEIHLVAVADRQRLVAVGRGQHVEIFGQQPRFEQLHICRNIINNQYSRSHESFFRCLRRRPNKS